MAGVPPVFKAWRKARTPLLGSTIEKAWNSEPFERFRDRMRQACPGCEKKELCMGGCPLMPEIVFCDSDRRAANGETVS